MSDEEISFIKKGTLKELLLLFFPILLMTFTISIYLLIEKIFLARFSVQAMEAAVSAAYASQITQAPCIALALMAQVFVGRWHGAREWKEMGPGLWQFIWFSFLSMFVTVPFSLIYGNLYFSGTGVEDIVLPYFYFLVFTNFTYPLGAALSCFFLGQGKTRLILVSTIVTQCIKILLAYFLIFGIEGWVPPLGLLGGAISTFIAQGGFCLILFAVFLNKKHREHFHTSRWQFHFPLFWECIHPGLLRAASRVLMLTSWASIAYLMTSKGGDFLLMISIGGTLFLFLPFLGDAICQAQITIISNILGSRNYLSLQKAFNSACQLICLVVAFVGIPLVLFPLPTFHYLFPKLVLSAETISHLFIGVWVSFAFFTFSYVPLSYVLAAKDTKFLLFMGCLNWVNGYLLMYFAIQVMNIPADQFWLCLSAMHASSALLYMWRMKALKSKLLPPLTSA